MFDPEPACKTLFGLVLSAYYHKYVALYLTINTSTPKSEFDQTYFIHSSSFAFDTMAFCVDNLDKLCLSTTVLFKYFPNLFKVC